MKGGSAAAAAREPESYDRQIHDGEGKLLVRLSTRGFRKIQDSLRRGEVRGVLSGRAAEGDEVPAVDEFTPISISYRAEAKGSRELDEAAFKNLQRQFPLAIGYFRSLRHVNAEASAEDYRLLQLMFGDRGGLLILVQTAMLGVSILHVFARDRGADLRFLGRFPLYEEQKPEVPAASVPIASKSQESPSDQKSDTHRMKVDSPPRIPAPQRAPAPEEVPPDTPAAFVITRRQVIRASAVIGLVLASGLATFGLLRLARRAKPPQEAQAVPVLSKAAARGVPVSLFIQEVGDHVDLIWDPGQEEVIRASQGSLTIFDNNTAHHEELSQAQLRRGRYSYKPVLHDVIFQLVFLRSDNSFSVSTASGSNLLQKNEAVVAAGGPARPGRQPKTEAPPRNPVTARSSGPSPAYVGSRSSEVPKPAVPQGRPAAPPPAEVSRPISRKEPEASPAPPAAPTPQTAAAESRQPSVTPPISTPAPAENPAAERSSAPASQLPQNSLPPNREANGEAPKMVTFTGPAPVRRVRPSLPSNVLSLIHDELMVKVVVSINAKGKVTRAELVPEKGVPNAVGIYVLQAAKLWQFEPGRRDGVAVDSQTTVQFRFEKQ